MKRRLSALALAGCLGLASDARAQFSTILLSENFNSLTLGSSVNLHQNGPPVTPNITTLATTPNTGPYSNAISKVGPASWTVNNNFDNFNTVDGIADINNLSGVPVNNPNPGPGEPLVTAVFGTTGIVVGNTGVPNAGDPDNGADEWEGWTFANRDFWVTAGGDQNRSQFTNASGTIAVVDADEYDDLGTGRGGSYMNSSLTTSAIPVGGLTNVKLAFDSSWRPEAYDDDHTGLGAKSNNQTAILWALFDDGSRTFVPGSLWDSWGGFTNTLPDDDFPTLPASPDFKPDATNEHVEYTVPVPGTATSVQFTFGYINAGNDWWWAIDNLVASNDANVPIWSENFDGGGGNPPVALGPSINERLDLPNTIVPSSDRAKALVTNPIAEAFTHTPPAMWPPIETSAGVAPGTAAIGDNDIGVFDFEGWSFTTRPVWTGQQSDPPASQFTKSDGIIAVADSDEFSDINGGSNSLVRPMSTIMTTKPLTIAGLDANTLFMQFDSSWNPEGNQKAMVTVSYDGGPEVTVLNWASNAGDLSTFHALSPNETVFIPLANPSGASTAQVRFKYLDGSNNWWWAIDNVQIGTVPEPTTFGLGGVALAALSLARRRRSAKVMTSSVRAAK